MVYYIKLGGKEAICMKGKMGFFYKKRIQNLVVFLLIIFLFNAIYSYISYSIHQVKHVYEGQLTEAGVQLAKEIKRSMQDSVVLIESLAEEFRDVEDIHAAEEVDKLKRICEKTCFARMWIANKNGRAVLSDGSYLDVSGREYVEKAFLGQSGISDIIISRVDGEKSVAVYTPVYLNGKVNGAMVGIYQLARLSDVMDIQSFDNEGYTQVFCGSDGQILIK